MKRSHSLCYLISQSRGIVRSRDMLNTYISTCTRPMATKHGKLVTRRDGLPRIIHINL